MSERPGLSAPIPGEHDGLMGIYAMLGILRQDLEKNSEAIAAHERNVSRALRGDGNGERGLNWRVAESERDIKVIRQQLDRIESTLASRSTETQKGVFSIGQAIVTGMFILAAAVIGYLAKGGR